MALTYSRFFKVKHKDFLQKGIYNAFFGSRLLASYRTRFFLKNAGLEDPEIFGLMQLIEDNLAADRISDMTIAILQKHFLERY